MQDGENPKHKSGEAEKHAIPGREKRVRLSLKELAKIITEQSVNSSPRHSKAIL